MGHSVLAVPVPALEGYVRGRTAFYDPSFLGVDATFGNAHVTVLGPWLPLPTAEQLALVAEVVADHRAFNFLLAEVGEFPDGIIYVRPEPVEPFAALTSALVAAFPQCPPYGGRFDDLVPHLTLDRRSATITPATVRAELGDLLPARARADRLDLQWWANDDCHVRHTWRLP